MSAGPGSHPLDRPLSEAEFGLIAETVERHLGINLPPAKKAMVHQRLRTPLLRAGFGSWVEFTVRALREPLSPQTLGLLADALTTNHTAFWREPEHFEHFRDRVLPERIAARSREKDLRVWCAATATGEEPYQLAMILADALRGKGWRAGLLATDVSERALGIARAGRYPPERLSRLPPAWRSAYVRFGADGAGSMEASLKADITFRRLNLLNPWPFRHPFDVIFCRNVLIYFESDLRHRVIGRLIDQLCVGGVLYVGHTESVSRGAFPIRALANGVWQKEAA